VQQGSRGHFVWVVDKGNRVEQRPVTVGEWYGDDWFIFEGLRNGDRVVVDGGLALQPGMSVSIKPYEARHESEEPGNTTPKASAAKGAK
jgi:membrane fusion protein (multidrug efflux system)